MASPIGKVLAELPIEDLRKKDGGAWNLQKPINWKLSSVAEFQGAPALRVFYQKNSGTSNDPGVGGLGISAVPRGLPSEAAVVEFQVFFDKGWHFSRGGKIGGFHIGHGEASGYRHSDTGSSHRIMWQSSGGAISYVYPPSNLRQKLPELVAEGHGCGFFKDEFPAGALRVGAWNTVRLGVKLNSFEPGGKPRADGEALLEINGTAATQGRIRWRRAADLDISAFEFGTFFGGPNPAVCDCTAYYKGFKLLQWK